MNPRHALTFIVTLTFLAATVSTAGAQGGDCAAAPGTAAVAEYCEALAGPRGDVEPGEDDGTERSISSKTRNTLSDSGARGSALLRSLGPGAAQDSRTMTAQVEGAANRKKNSHRGPGNGADTPGTTAPGGDALSAITAAVEAGPSSGATFVWLLLGLALAISAVGWHRFRTR